MFKSVKRYVWILKVIVTTCHLRCWRSCFVFERSWVRLSARRHHGFYQSLHIHSRNTSSWHGA